MLFDEYFYIETFIFRRSMIFKLIISSVYKSHNYGIKKIHTNQQNLIDH